MNIPGPQVGLNQLIDAFAVQVIEDRAKKKYTPLRPSNAGACEMEMGLDYMEYRGYAAYQPEIKDPATARLLNLGHSIETHANWEMRDAFAKSPKEIRIKYKQQAVDICTLHDGTLMEGHLDLWIETDEWRGIADWKSKKDKYSSFYSSSWDEFIEGLCKTGHAKDMGSWAYITDLKAFLEQSRDVFFNKNLYQLNMYGISDFAQKRKIDFCSVMQYNKNDSRIREIRFTPDKRVDRTEVFKRVALTVDTTRSVEGLTKEHMLGSLGCAFCKHRKVCWEDHDAMKLYFKTLPPKAWAKDLDRLSQDVQDQLPHLIDGFEKVEALVEQAQDLEEKAVKLLDREKVYKVRLRAGTPEERVYQVRDLKTGGVANGPRRVLRRSKN